MLELNRLVISIVWWFVHASVLMLLLHSTIWWHLVHLLHTILRHLSVLILGWWSSILTHLWSSVWVHSLWHSRSTSISTHRVSHWWVHLVMWRHLSISSHGLRSTTAIHWLAIAWTRHGWLTSILLLLWLLLTVHWLLLLSITWSSLWRTSIAVGLLLSFAPLTCVIHFDSSSKNLFSLHFLKSAFTFFFWSELYESISFWRARYRVADHFCLMNTWKNLFE